MKKVCPICRILIETKVVKTHKLDGEVKRVESCDKCGFILKATYLQRGTATKQSGRLGGL